MYIPFERCVKEIGKPVNAIIHIGAHRGQEAQDYAKSGVREVLWVEANKKMMKHLYDQTCNLPMKSRYFCATLSDVDNEMVTLNITNNEQSTSILELGTHATMYPHITISEKVTVYTKRFDTLWRENVGEIDLDRYDFINIDVQGAELKVLKGFGDIFNRVPIRAIYAEVNFEHVYKGCCLVDELDEFLAGFGFQRFLTAAPEGTWGDALYLRKV